MAGGLDTFDWLKDRAKRTNIVIDLSQVAELRGIKEANGGLEIGALTTLTEVTRHPVVREQFGLLREAAELVASPQIRNMGTVGGNLCLDTRCTYYNQTPFWRRSLGYCLKREGDTCHVVPGGTRCVAASSSDGVTMLVALSAEALVVGPAGARWVAVEDLFLGEGRRNLRLEPSELVAEVRIPPAAAGATAAYEGNLIQRHFQDIHVITQHLQGRPAHYELVGRHWLGLPVDEERL